MQLTIPICADRAIAADHADKPLLSPFCGMIYISAIGCLSLTAAQTSRIST